MSIFRKTYKYLLSNSEILVLILCIQDFTNINVDSRQEHYNYTM